MLLSISFGCHTNNSNLSIKVKDSGTIYSFEARYPESKTGMLETYIDQELNNELPLDQHIDLIVNLANGEKFNLKASKGILKIEFDKKNSSVRGYIEVKKLAEGIKNRLSEK